MQYDVFISYSRKDTPIAVKICKALDDANITYFIDRQGIGGGLEFPKVIANAILESRLFLFLASENSYTSKFTSSEITFAFNKKPKETIVPYIIDNSSLPIDLEFVFSSINFRTLKDHPITPILINDIIHLLDETNVDRTTANSSLCTRSKFKYLINSMLIILVTIEFVLIAIKGYDKVGALYYHTYDYFFITFAILCSILTITGYVNPRKLQLKNRAHVTLLYLLPTFASFALIAYMEKYSLPSYHISDYNVYPVIQKDTVMKNDAKIITNTIIKKGNIEPKTDLVNSNTQSTPQLSNEASLALALKSSGSEKEKLLLKLAQKGYSKAFIPLAKYYLSNPLTHNKADKWANKAKKQYTEEANDIIKCLKEYGYYD